MPCFMALSGMVFAYAHKDTGLCDLVRKKARRLLVPFFLVTLFFSTPLKYIGGYWDTSVNPLGDIVVGQFLLFGNSHLWFVVSLFWITIAFYILHSYKMTSSLLFWLLSAAAAYCGHYLNKNGSHFGIPGALNLFLFFASGYFMKDVVKGWRVHGLVILLSWVLMGAAYICSSFWASERLKVALWLFFALCGCFNMITTAKWFTRKIDLNRFRVYRMLRNHSYGLYLYSDPFNYILIPVIVVVFGENFLCGTLSSLMAFLSRFFATVILAFIVISLIGVLRRLMVDNKAPLKMVNE